ncbi:hypothetical protein AVEN_161610-1 [Araneus ventricosus]|uniref:Uncharacterized protein n=1 Tax=Araneus ventricosus TaxID=182803 RepID=A0A4Y2FN18_ARAVE|nr:hypothetical protein AVEN_161610-1 [Araneus ventricosus]
MATFPQPSLLSGRSETSGTQTYCREGNTSFFVMLAKLLRSPWLGVAIVYRASRWRVSLEFLSITNEEHHTSGGTSIRPRDETEERHISAGASMQQNITYTSDGEPF